MKFNSVKLLGLAFVLALTGAQNAFAEDRSKLDRDWSKSGFGSDVTYKCKLPSCGAKSVMKVAKFGGISGVPELGIPDGSNVEAEFRRRPEVRRILGAMLQQVLKETRNKGSRLSSSYFTKPDYVGFELVAFDARENVHAVFQLRINDNKALMLMSQAESAALARRNYNLLPPTIKSN